MKTSARLRPLFGAALLACALSCSGSPMGGGIAGTSSVRAPISGFGSVIVGGIEFDIDSAVVTIEGDPARASDLELGMVATVRGTVDASGRPVWTVRVLAQAQ
mgnify:CR=1 FL=1